MKHPARYLVLLSAAAVSLAFAASAGTASPAKAESVAKVTKVTATLGKPAEMRTTLSRASAPRGTVIFRVVNKGALAHDFKIAGKKSALVQPGGSAVLRVVFKKAGTYRWLCTVAGHAAAGMKGVFSVK